MSTTPPRHSSKGGRRAERAHQPYRGDQVGVGKRTGVPIREVERQSDGFEDFGDLMQQVDSRAPPLKRRKMKQSEPQPEEEPEFDEDGLKSMEIDESSLRYIQTSKPASSNPRIESSSVSVPRTSDVDFDEVPSPRPQSIRGTRTPRPSRLSQTIARGEFFDDAEFDDAEFYESPLRYIQTSEPASSNGRIGSSSRPVVRTSEFDIDESPLRYIQTSKLESSDGRNGSSSRSVARTSDVDFDEVPSPRPQSVRGTHTPCPRGEFFDDEAMDGSIPDDFPQDDSSPHTSFQEMDQDDEDAQPDTKPAPASSSKKKGKAKVVEPEVEDEIQQGLNDEEPHPKKSKKTESKAQPDRKKVVRVRQKEKHEVPKGVRRSTRVPIEPLQWWRGEKVVYGRTGDEQDPVLVAPIKEIQRIKALPEPPLRGKKPGRKRKRAAKPAENPANPEEGWDDRTTGVVKCRSLPELEQVERQIAFTASMMNPTTALNNECLYQRLFGDGQAMAAGELIIPPTKRKETKRTGDNTFVFYVIEGAINLNVNDASMVLATGAAFIVPRGNSYFIENVGRRDARLFFSQTRVEPSEKKRASSVRRSSAAAPSSDPPSKVASKRAVSSRI